MTILAYLAVGVLGVMYLRKMIHRDRNIFIDNQPRYSRKTVMRKLAATERPLSDGNVADELYPKE